MTLKQKLFEFGVSKLAQIGIYEKALPKDITWLERLKLTKELGFDFIEMSIDETDERLARLDWTKQEIDDVREAMEETGIRINSICLSAHRRFPYGSNDKGIREEASAILRKALLLAHKLSVTVIQVAGYDVFYEEKSILSRERFIEGLQEGVSLASQLGVILSIEVMDDQFMNSITKFQDIKKEIHSPYLQVYPDLGNLSAWPENNPASELEKGIDNITSIHLKDTLPVTTSSEGQFRDVPFGEGCVDFLGLLKTLKRLSYNGTFLIEMWSESNPEFKQEITKAKDFLYPKLMEAGYEIG